MDLSTARFNGGDPYFGGFIGRASTPSGVPSKEIVQTVRGGLGASTAVYTPSRATPSQSSNVCTPYAFLVKEAKEGSRFGLGALVWADQVDFAKKKRKQYDNLISTEELVKRVWYRYTELPDGMFNALASDDKKKNGQNRLNQLEMKPFALSDGDTPLPVGAATNVQSFLYNIGIVKYSAINIDNGFLLVEADNDVILRNVRSKIFKLVDDTLKARPAAIVTVTPTEQHPNVNIAEQYNTAIQGPCLTNIWSQIDVFAGDRVYMCVLANVSAALTVTGLLTGDIKDGLKETYDKPRKTGILSYELDNNTAIDLDFNVAISDVSIVPATSRTLKDLGKTASFGGNIGAKNNEDDGGGDKIGERLVGRVVVGAWEIGKVVDGAAGLPNMHNPKTTSTVNVNIKWVPGDVLNRLNQS